MFHTASRQSIWRHLMDELLPDELASTSLHSKMT